MHLYGVSPASACVLTPSVFHVQEEAVREHAKHRKYVSKKNEEVKTLIREVKMITIDFLKSIAIMYSDRRFTTVREAAEK